MSLLSLLNNSCTVRRSTPAIDPVTGSTYYTYTDTSGFDCRIQIRSVDESGQPAQAGVAYVDVYFDTSADVTFADNLVSIADGWANMTIGLVSQVADDCGGGPYKRFVGKYKTGQFSPKG